MSNQKATQFKNYIGVKGWLLFFCISLTIITPLNGIFALYISITNDSIQFIQAVLSVIAMIFGFRAGIALWMVKPGAVDLTKRSLIYILICHIVSLFFLFSGEVKTNENIGLGILGPFIYVGIWYQYLCVSERVKATYVTYSFSKELQDISSESEKSEINADTYVK